MSGKYALIIGNTEYVDPGLAKLTAPGKDASEFARVLGSKDICAFDDVQVILDEPEPVVREAIDGFFGDKKPDDLLILYFSGHGVRDEFGSLYLALRNTNRLRLRATALKSDFIRESMDQSRSRRQVLVLDCCNSGAFAQGTKGATGVSIGTAAAFEGTGYGRVVLTATDSTQFAWEGDRVIGSIENSLFTYFLVKGLEGEADTDGDGRITIDELYDYAYEKIVNATPKQTPGKWSFRQQGEIILRQAMRIEDIKPIKLSDDLVDEIADTRPYVREAAVQKLVKLLHGKNIGLALSAKAALQGIITDQDTTYRVAQAARQALEAFDQSAEQAVTGAATEAESQQADNKHAEERPLPIKEAEAEPKPSGASQTTPKQQIDEGMRAKEQAARPAVAEIAKRVAAPQVESAHLPTTGPSTSKMAARFPMKMSVPVLAGIGLVIVAAVVGIALLGKNPSQANKAPTEAVSNAASSSTEAPTQAATAPAGLPAPEGPVVLNGDGVVYSVAFSPDGTILAAGEANGMIVLWDTSTRVRLDTWQRQTQKNITSVAFSPDGTLLAAGSEEGTVELWDVKERKIIGDPLRGHTDTVQSIAFSPDGRLLADASWDSTVVLWNVATHEPIGSPLAGHTSTLLTVTFSPDGKVLASGGDDKTVRIWDVGTQQAIGDPLTGHTDSVRSLAFSPDGTKLVSGSDDNTMITWDTSSWQPIGDPAKGHSSAVTSLAFSPNGKVLASGSWDNTVILWNTETGQQMGAPLEKHSDSVFSVAFSPDGRTLASGSQDATVVLWDVRAFTQ